MLASLASGQAAPSQPAGSASLGASSMPLSALGPSNAAAQPIEKSGSNSAGDPATLPSVLPPLPRGKTTLIGGYLEKIDPVRDQFTIHVFGARRMKILFDPRTRVYRDGKLTTPAALKTGERIYVDTMLEGTTIFARAIRFNLDSPAGEAQGSVVSYHADRDELLVRDALDREPLRINLTSSTRIGLGERQVDASELAPGTLVAVKFDSEKDGRDVAREVSILAVPGGSFTFAGQVVAVDLRTGLLVLSSATDRKTYEIYFDPSTASVKDKLREGAEISVLARFDGDRYTAQNVTVNSPAKP
jgi:hypothetical protein